MQAGHAESTPKASCLLKTVWSEMHWQYTAADRARTLYSTLWPIEIRQETARRRQQEITSSLFLRHHMTA